MALTKLITDLIDGSLGTDWQATPKTANFTAVAGEGYFVNTTSAAITVTLPSSPTAGDEVSIIDYGANASTNNITITSSDNIEGAADDLTLSTDKISKTLVYSDATKGWLVTTDAGAGAAAAPALTVDYLVVAGGGSGGDHTGGGGGAGGFRTSYGSVTGGGGSAESSLTLDTLTNYTVTVGAGASIGGAADGDIGNKGSNSAFSLITSEGGGYGGGGGYYISNYGAGGNGGSGGGAGIGPSGGSAESGGAASTSPVQGYDGGDGIAYASPYPGAGGGGAGAVGGNAASSTGGDGGNGLTIQITGSSVTYAGGGGGSGSHSGGTPGSGGTGGGGNGGGETQNGVAGAANTGSGGGGGGKNRDGGAGGSGIVILRYPDYYDIVVGSGLTTGVLNSPVGSSEKYTTFTAGTGSISFGAA